MSSSFTKEYVLQLIDQNDLALAKAILAIAARQTADEHAGERTHVANGRGFNQIDAPFLTSIAKALPKWNNHMTPKQIARARPMMRKYWRQLIEVAQERHQIDEVAHAAVAEALGVSVQQPSNFGRFA